MNVLLPEELAAEPPASWGARLGAAFLDCLCVASLFFLLEVLFSNAWKQGTGHVFAIRYSDPSRIGAELLWVALNAGLLRKRGQTLGKMMAGTRIVRRDGLPASFWYLLARRYAPVWGLGLVLLAIDHHILPSMLHFLQGPISMLLLLDILLIFRGSHACLHDDVARTKVIYARTEFHRIARA